MVIESCNQNWKSSVLEGAMYILLKGLLLELSGHGNPHDNATPKVIPDSNSCILGLSNEVSFVSGFFWKGGQNSQNV